MSARQVTRRDPKTGAVRKYWMIDINYEHPEGRIERVRKVSPVQTRRGAEQHERSIRQALVDGTYGKKEKQPTPTVAEFWKDFYDAYVLTENKASEHVAKQAIWKNHIEPHFGRLRLDEIGAEHIARYKAAKLKLDYNKKSVGNHFAVLRRMLAVAIEWGRLSHMPRREVADAGAGADVRLPYVRRGHPARRRSRRDLADDDPGRDADRPAARRASGAALAGRRSRGRAPDGAPGPLRQEDRHAEERPLP